MSTMESKIITPESGLFHRIVQIGIVVRSIEETVKRMNQLFGWEVYSYAVTPKGAKLYRGEKEDFTVKMAFFRLNTIEIELLEPIEGRSVWQDFLDERGEGLHHILFDVNNFEAAKTALENSGLPMVQCGPSARFDGCRWAYFDGMKDLGYYIEIFNPSEYNYQCL